MDAGGGTAAEPARRAAQSGLAVELPVFTGPLDLLLHLIQKNRISIYDIPIAIICDQYHETLKQLQELDLDLASEFVAMASWLVYLKSRMLLPRHPGRREEDPREELVERLLEYRRVKALADMLHGEDVVRRCLWTPNLERGAWAEGEEAPVELEAVDLRVLARAYLEVMERYAAQHPPPLQVLPLRHTVEQKMKDLYRRVREERLVRLLTVLHSLADVEEVVTLVMATLELVRLGGVRAEQRRHFAEIFLRPGTVVLDASALAVGEGDHGHQGT